MLRTAAMSHPPGAAAPRVLLVSPVGEVGGAEKVFLSLAQHLPAHGIEPLLACMRPGPLAARAAALGVETHVFAEHRFREPIQVLRGARWLAALARHTRAGLLHSNHMGHLYGAPAARAAGIPEVWHLYDYPYSPDLLERLVSCIPAQRVIFMTERVRAGFPRLSARPSAVIAPICVEPARLRAVPPAPDVRMRYRLTPGPLLLTVARLQEHKGHRFLIEAVPAVLRSRPGAQFVIVGKASGPEQERYREELKARCVRLGITEQVRFLGHVGDSDLVALCREAVALVHPATTEGFGLVLLEAMSLGTPVIAAAADGPQELLTHGKTGLLVPPGDGLALADAVLTLLKDVDLARTLRCDGADHAATFRVEEMIRQTVAVYRQTLGSFAPRGRRPEARTGGSELATELQGQ